MCAGWRLGVATERKSNFTQRPCYTQGSEEETPGGKKQLANPGIVIFMDMFVMAGGKRQEAVAVPAQAVLVQVQEVHPEVAAVQEVIHHLHVQQEQ
jgi:hypothetical protein